jgi:hypothetical protein
MKMVYNGATRQEALAARHPEHIKGDLAAQAYGKVLRCLNPASPECLECSVDDLESACHILVASEVSIHFSQAQNQVIDHLQKVIQYVKEGTSVQTAIKTVWDLRDAAAQSRLLDARANFSGTYPSGGAHAFGRALEFLSPDSLEDGCSLEAMESTFRELDSELVRLECSDAQQTVIDDLWRLIKMMYNGATRQEALAARRPDRIQDHSLAQAFKKVLLYLNPSSSESATCSQSDLESHFRMLNAARAEFSGAQNQVIDQLEKAVHGVKGGDSVQTAVKKAWDDRDNAARNILN